MQKRNLIFPTALYAAISISLFCETEGRCQNIGINTTGAAPASANMLEVLDTKTMANSTGLYVSQSGGISGTGYALQAIKSGASLNNIAAYLSATGATNNYALIIPAGGGFAGFGTSTPGAALDVKSTIRLSGSTSGFVGLTVPVAAGSTTYTLPAADGASGDALTTNGSGTLSWASAGGGGGIIDEIRKTHAVSYSTNGTPVVVVTLTPSAGNYFFLNSWYMMAWGGQASVCIGSTSVELKFTFTDGSTVSKTGSGGGYTRYDWMGTTTFSASSGTYGWYVAPSIFTSAYDNKKINKVEFIVNSGSGCNGAEWKVALLEISP